MSCIYLYAVDVEVYRKDKLASVNNSCILESASTMVRISDNCNVDILQLCNGVSNCPDCADEIEETCLGVLCSGGCKRQNLIHKYMAASGEKGPMSQNAIIEKIDIF